MKLREFLLKHTEVCELCIITRYGWNEASAYIDSEDLFMNSLSYMLLESEVKSERWEDYTLLNHNKTKQLVEVHVIDVD